MPAAFSTTIASFLRVVVDRAGCQWRTPGQALARVLLPTLGRRPRTGAARVGFVRLRGGCGSRAAPGASPVVGKQPGQPPLSPPRTESLTLTLRAAVPP